MWTNGRSGVSLNPPRRSGAAVAVLLGQGPRQARRQDYASLAEALADALPLTLADALARGLGIEPHAVHTVEEAPEPEPESREPDELEQESESKPDFAEALKFYVPPLPSLDEALATLNRVASPPMASRHDDEADPKAARQSARRALDKSSRIRKSYSDDTELADIAEPAAEGVADAAIVNRMHKISMTDRAWLYDAAMRHHDRSAQAQFDNRYWQGAAESVLAGEP